MGYFVNDKSTVFIEYMKHTRPLYMYNLLCKPGYIIIKMFIILVLSVLQRHWVGQVHSDRIQILIAHHFNRIIN